MNLNSLVNMVVRTVTRRLINLGINKGIAMASGGKGKNAKAAKGKGDGGQGRTARETAKRARQAAKITRRMGR